MKKLSFLYSVITIVGFGILTIFLFVFPPSAAANQNTFDEDFKQAITSAQIESLLKKYPAEGDKIIPKLESKLINEVNDKIGNILIIKEIIPTLPASSYSAIFEFSPPKTNSYFAPSSERINFITGSITIGQIENSEGFVEYIAEFPKDRIIIPQRLLEPALPPFGTGSIHRFRGQVEFDGYVFVGEGDKLNRLTFCLINNLGYVYLRGKGKVLLKDGKEIKIGY